MKKPTNTRALEFLSTLSLRRATVWELAYTSQQKNFYPRSPCGERRKIRPVAPDISSNFYPRSPCGERLFRQNYECFEWIISIHALLAESDLNLATS